MQTHRIIDAQVNAPRALSLFLAQMALGLLIVQVMIARIQKLPVDKIVGAFKPPGEKGVVGAATVANRVTGWKEAPTMAQLEAKE